MISIPTLSRIGLLLIASASAACAPASSQAASGDMTLDRFVERQTARIMAADTDGDGKISRAESAAALANGTPKRAGKAGRDPVRVFDAMDLNHDGYLDKAEITAALTKRFHKRDLNGDGILSPEERMASRSAREQDAPMSDAPKPAT